MELRGIKKKTLVSAEPPAVLIGVEKLPPVKPATPAGRLQREFSTQSHSKIPDINMTQGYMFIVHPHDV